MPTIKHCDRCGGILPYGLKYAVSIRGIVHLHSSKSFIVCPSCADLILKSIENTNERK